MKTIGIRTSNTCIRYAIVDYDGNKYTMLNKDNHRVNIPKNLADEQCIYDWVYKEIGEIVRNEHIEKAAIRENAYLKEKKSLRHSNRIDAIVALALKHAEIPTKIRLLNCNQEDMKKQAEDLCGKTDKYWDVDIAAAILMGCGNER